MEEDENGKIDVTDVPERMAVVLIADLPIYTFGVQAVGSETSKTFTLTHAHGAVDATDLDPSTDDPMEAPFGFPGDAFPGTGGDCDYTLAPAGSCVFVVNFKPTAVGSYADTLVIKYMNGVLELDAQVEVQGYTPAVLAYSEGEIYDYGLREVNESVDKTITVSNNGGFTATALATAALDAPFGFKGGTYPGTGGDCGTELAAEASCTMVVAYNPTAGGTHAATLALAYVDGATETAVSLPLSGTASGDLSVSDGTSYDYGTVANSTTSDRVFTLTNSAGVAMTGLSASGLSGMYAFKGGSYPGTGADCSTSIAAGGSCTIAVSFTPTSSGLHSGSLAIAYNNGIEASTHTVSLSGTGQIPAALGLSDSGTHDFGTKALTSSTDKTFTVTNTGEAVATGMWELASEALAAPFSFKDGTYPGTGGTCTTSLAGSGGTCTFVVNYNPTADGIHSDSVVLTYNDGFNTQSVAGSLDGKTAANLSISDGATYDYGNVRRTTSADKTFTITNSGGATASSIQESVAEAMAAPFGFNGGTFPGTGGTCATATPLASGATCTVVVTFSPTTTATSSDYLVLSYDNSLATTTSSRAIQGTGFNVAVLSLSGANPYEFGSYAKGTTGDRTFTLSHGSGTITATQIAEKASAALAAPFAFKGGSGYPGSDGTCGSSLAAGTNCTLTVRYSPTASATQTDTITLTIQYDDGTGGGTANQQAARVIEAVNQSGWSTGTASGLAGRYEATAIWTGSELLVWGGRQDTNTKYKDGGKYDPITDSWSAIESGVTAPDARSGHTAIWADTLGTRKMIVWGGLAAADAPLSSGGMYDPAANTWTATRDDGTTPTGRYGHAAVWDGTNNLMYVWGGADAGGTLATEKGFTFDPSAGSGTWTEIDGNIANTPSARFFASAVFAGGKLYVWGGCGTKGTATYSCALGQEKNDGAFYDPSLLTWTAMATLNAPAARFMHTAMWSGTKMVIWGGATDTAGNGTLSNVSTGGMYVPPGSESWTATSNVTPATARRQHIAALANGKMLIWGGLTASGEGKLLNLTTNTWSAMTTTNAPTATFGAVGAWTGDTDLRFITFGGWDGAATYNSAVSIYAPE